MATSAALRSTALFDVPLEDGLCEVLRAEVDVADVIRPTHAEGLWLLTAGYCDVDAIHALATEQMQPVFEKLRTEYDFIIIDGAPVLGMSDALIFGQYCDGAILSVRRDYSQMHKINEAAALAAKRWYPDDRLGRQRRPNQVGRPRYPVAIDRSEVGAAVAVRITDRQNRPGQPGKFSSNPRRRVAFLLSDAAFVWHSANHPEVSEGRPKNRPNRPIFRRH